MCVGGGGGGGMGVLMSRLSILRNAYMLHVSVAYLCPCHRSMKKPCHYYVTTFCEALADVNKRDVACEIQEIVMSPCRI